MEAQGTAGTRHQGLAGEPGREIQVPCALFLHPLSHAGPPAYYTAAIELERQLSVYTVPAPAVTCSAGLQTLPISGSGAFTYLQAGTQALHHGLNLGLIHLVAAPALLVVAPVLHPRGVEAVVAVIAPQV